ncbi:hypothetical protein [Gottschalkia acidurici]|uniref:hypothetical protein n=1 Tax=Clostridium acidurici TaxID=1556 RepID=UPI00059F1FCD|nr:hypothetical protein [Gottschalkia acidurici]
MTLCCKYEKFSCSFPGTGDLCYRYSKCTEDHFCPTPESGYKLIGSYPIADCNQCQNMILGTLPNRGNIKSFNK